MTTIGKPFFLPWVKGLRSADFEAGWRQLFNMNFDSTVEQISSLMQIIDLLEKMQLN